MQPVSVDACPCCGGMDMAWPFQPNQEMVGRFLLLSSVKYGGCMDGWEKQLTLIVAQCRNCGHIWHHTRPDQESLFMMYAKGKRLKGGAASTVPNARILSAMRELFYYCGAVNGVKRLLDFGSGAGRWSVAAKQAGFSTTAYEPSTSRQGDIDDIEVVSDIDSLKGRLFDAINLEQVLEHVPNPLETLLGLKRFCNPDTILRISVPDVERQADKLWQGFPFDGKTMHLLSPYEHLHGFRRSSLMSLLREAGLYECSSWRLRLGLTRYALERCSTGMGFPFGRTTTLARFVINS